MVHAHTRIFEEPWAAALRRKIVGRLNGINLFLAGDKITATACVTFNKSFIDNAIACLLASGAKTSRGNLDRLAVFLMEDDRHIVIRAFDLGDGHHRPPLQTPVKVTVLSVTLAL
jgi:hypothetical protein